MLVILAIIFVLSPSPSLLLLLTLHINKPTIHKIFINCIEELNISNDPEGNDGVYHAVFV